MKKLVSLILTLVVISISSVFSCTNYIVTKGASKDGSTFLVYTNDGEWLYKPDITPAKDHKKGDSLSFTSRYGAKGKIPQVAHTYAVIGFQMNEHQVAIGETTFTGREELWNKSKYLEYWHFMQLALARSETAREAVKVITSLAEKYGYGSEGESFSIIDPEEAWILEMVGTGDGGEGAIWVAVRIPDGYISAHANMARIGEFPKNDPENCLYSENVESFAIDKGYYNPSSGDPFRFNEAYNPPSPDRLKYCESRVWSLFTKSAPSLNLSPDYHRGVQGAERYPLWIKPDKKPGLEDIKNMIRDHYEGTPYDMTKGIEAGPFGNPNRIRPLDWEVDGEKCSWERPISTYNTAFSFIAQSRSFLPDEIGGVVWFGVDDTYFTCYIPFYNCITEIPKPFTIGDINKYSGESAWWTFNFVSNFANIRYSYMIKDIQKVQNELENSFFVMQDSVETVAKNLNKKKKIKFLTEYSCSMGVLAHSKWTELGEYLITKYNDGYIKNDKGHPEAKGYPEEWLRRVDMIEKGKFRIPDWNSEHKLETMPF
jgi:dipeptidase